MPIIVDPGIGAPAVRARSVLSSEVARYVLRPDDAEALSVAADGLNDGIRRLNTRPWEWSKTYQDLTLVAGTATYTLSTAWHAPRVAALLNGSSKIVGTLEWLDSKSFDTCNPDQSTSGDPSSYTVHAFADDGLVTLDRAPSAAFISTYPTLRLKYYAKVQYLTNDADTLGGPSEVESFLCWHAKAYCASIYNPTKTQYADTQADRYWALLSRAEMHRQLTDWEGGAYA